MWMWTVVLSLLLPSTWGLNVVIYSSCAAGSHVATHSAIVNTLTAAGHNVDLIMARVNSLIKNAGSHSASRVVVVDFPGMKSPWNEKVRHLADPFVDTTPSNPFSSLLLSYVDISIEMCTYVLDSPEVRELLSSRPYDVALSTGYDFCGQSLFHAHGIGPVSTFSTLGIFPFQAMRSGYPELPIYDNDPLDPRPHWDRSNFGTRVMELIRTLYRNWMHAGQAGAMNHILGTRFGRNFSDVRDIVRNVSFDFLNTLPLLEEPRPISTRTKFIGGLDLAHAKPLDSFYEGILSNDRRGTFLFSLGTQVPPQNIPPSVIDAFRIAFRAFPNYNFIWKYDGKTKFDEPNIFNVDWVPQSGLLHSGKITAFITHMGLNSFMEASLAGYAFVGVYEMPLGVPLICLPLFVDQFYNARRAVKLGTGIPLDKASLTAEAITEAIQKILNDSRRELTKGVMKSDELSVHQAAVQLASTLHDYPESSRQTLVDSLVFASKHPHSHFLTRLHGSQHSFIERHGFDTVAFVSFILSTAAFTVVYFLVALISGRCAFTVRKDKRE